MHLMNSVLTQAQLPGVWLNIAAKKTEKKTVKKSGEKKTGAKKGTKYACSECGMVVTVDEVCGCVDVCDLICCGEQMEVKA